MISKPVNQGWVGVNVSSSGTKVLLQAIYDEDQARVVLTPDQAISLARELQAFARQAKRKEREK